MMDRPVRAREDRSLSARITEATSLTYDDDPKADVDDRPPFVRAGSSLAYIYDELGRLEGIRLTFSDAALLGERILFSASAEASDSSDYIAGSVLGLIDGQDVRWTVVRDTEGDIFAGKIEGLSVPPDEPGTAYFVIDADDVGKASNIYEVELSGPWQSRND